jgi:hypothetical protein
MYDEKQLPMQEGAKPEGFSVSQFCLGAEFFYDAAGEQPYLWHVPVEQKLPLTPAA